MLTIYVIVALFASMGGINGTPLPQNPMETVGLTVMTFAGTAAEAIQNGGAVRKEHELESPILSMRSKAEGGMGDAMRPRNDEDSDEDRRRRRKRSNAGTIAQPMGALEGHVHNHRGKRSPCHTYTQSTDTGTDDVEEVARRKRLQRKRAAAKKSGKSTTSKSKKSYVAGLLLHRERRQAADLGEHAEQFGVRVRTLWESFVGSVNQMVDQLKETFAGSANAPADAEYM